MYWGVLVLLVLLYLPKLFLAESRIYSDLLTPRLLAVVASLLKLLLLVVATIYASRCLRCFEPGNPVRPAWFLLTVGLGLYVLGQSVLGVYQVILAIASPFPSPADLFFVLSMLVLIASLLAFVSAYHRVGYPIGGRAELVLAGGLGVALIAAVAIAVLRPLAGGSAPPLESLLNLAYPILDCFLLVPALVLLRMAVKLRGGSLWKVWMLLLLGFSFIAAGDILFAYFTTLDLVALDPLLDLAFALAYLFLAWGTREQYLISSR